MYNMSLIKHCKRYLILKLWQLVRKKWLSLFGSNLFGSNLFGSNLFGSNLIFGSNIFLRIKCFFGYIYSNMILITFLAHVDVMSLPHSVVQMFKPLALINCLSSRSDHITSLHLIKYHFVSYFYFIYKTS